MTETEIIKEKHLTKVISETSKFVCVNSDFEIINISINWHAFSEKWVSTITYSKNY